ncbi:MAG: hypothetical protein ACD_73C00521G0001 [uncultured bacterium]|nr:MAG: hypothetical protein ACD_73C00521G0001 [uncultured bacterium]
MGERWFLGKIYYYAHPGTYFDVPISNFLGWYGVAAIIIGGFVFIEKILHLKQPYQPNHSSSKLVNLINNYGAIGLYFGIFLFNWGLTLFIGEYSLALIDLLWISIPVFFLFPLDLFKRHYYT